MNNTTIHITNYKGSFANLNGQRQSRITKIDIARGLLSIGKTHWSQYLKSPRQTVVDFLHYWTGLDRFINVNPELTITTDYSNLDLSDKVLKSYHIGMGVSKIIAERVLKIPYLQHVDVLVKQGIVVLTTGTNERGDMVGFDRLKNWHVMEAKGRTIEPSKVDKKKAKAQAEKITSVNGINPATKSYCITHINQLYSEILLNDPDDIPIKKLEIEIKSDNFIKTYYDKILRDFYKQKEDVILSFIDQNIDFALFRLFSEQTNIYLGIERRILSDLKQGSTGFTETLLSQNSVFDSFAELNIDTLSIGNDGILLYQDTENILTNRITPANTGFEIGAQTCKLGELRFDCSPKLEA